MALQFRTARPDEAECVMRLINRAFQVERFFVDGDRVNLEQVQHYFESGEFLWAEDERGVAGVVYLERRGERAYLGMLSVEPERQGGGIGSQLMDASEQRLRESGVEHLDLMIVNVRSGLPEFYSRRGFSESGTSPFPQDVPTKVPCHFIHMTKRLV